MFLLSDTIQYNTIQYKVTNQTEQFLELFSQTYFLVIVKKSSPKNLSADCRPTVGRLSADS